MADLNQALENMLSDYDARRRADAERERMSKEDAAAFLERFSALRREVVRPVFESALVSFAAHGHQASITEEEFARDGQGKVTEAGITLHFVPAGEAAARDDAPSNMLAITTRHYNKSVWFSAGKSMGDGGLAGSKGAYPTTRVNRALVEEELLKFVAGVVAA